MIPKRSAALAAVGLAGALTLAACGSSSSSGGSGGSSSGKPTYTIGFQGPLSVNSPQLGINGLDGVITAINEVNNDASAPFKLKLVKSDDQGDPSVAPTAAQTLVDNSSVIAVVGPMFSGATKASEPKFSAAHLLSVSPSATAVTLTTLGFSTFYRDVPPDSTQGKQVGDFLAKKLKAKKVFSLDDASTYGTGLSSVLEAQLNTDGVSVSHDSINPTQDYTAEATKVIAANPDALYYSGYYQQFSLLAKALRGAGYKGALMSGDGSNDDQYIAGAGSAAEGTYLSCPCGDANVDPKDAAFLADYKKYNNNAAPGTYSPEAYDATNAIISVLKGLGSGKVTRQSVSDAFKSVNFPGITKTLSFTATGEVQQAVIYVYQVTNGKRKVLGTVSSLTGS